jgi:hypothetical protein
MLDNDGLIEEPITPIPAAIDAGPGKVRLGERLFHDPRLSHDNSVACASCRRWSDIYEPLLICGIDDKDVYHHNHFDCKRRLPSDRFNEFWLRRPRACIVGKKCSQPTGLTVTFMRTVCSP